MLLLYCLVILLTLLVTTFTLFSVFIYLLLFVVIFYSVRKTYLAQDEILFSESGLIERERLGIRHCGEISGRSFYNEWVIFLRLNIKQNPLSEKYSNQFIVIYKDAVSKENYRLLAQVIHNKRY